ncbi:uncharacterized protein EKO05_0006885 [Ascochyta rabiei]|uniref:Uncharacterized protein n=1 Tax=Didymella rabiei TaxID=5454 RepID=A0A162Z1P8_DIDRA|nr:uncharacterized protein EKO05_0006885 [Ascochyta rabiei]KZM20351.1 hypothetical protein ST47_g8542 [Ascochyta rabiei]UPX16487.1 hypothetical protein EKO05_0006885 [Ascochyta rabiei]
MVAPRRSGGNMTSTSNNPPKGTKLRRITNASRIEKPHKPAAVRHSILRYPPPQTNSSALSKSNIGLDGLTSTSSTTERISEGCSSTIPEVFLPEKARVSTEQVMVALQKLITPGTSHNPIVLTEDSPPLSGQARTRHSLKLKPHRSQERHSKLYIFKSPYTALGPRPASGSTFTGRQSHDKYRMRTAKMAQPDWHLRRDPTYQQELPFELQYPMSAQYLAPQQNIAYPQPGVRCYAPHLLTYRRPPTEEQLQIKAVQYIREYPRLSPRRREMAEDPDEISESESEEIDLDTARSPPNRGPTQNFRCAAETKDEPSAGLLNPYIQLTPLVEHASLLSSLLRAYPQSRDQMGLREDIAMLASIQNQHLADWMKFESGRSRKQANPHTPCASKSTTISPVKSLVSRLTEPERARAEERRRQDDEIRGFLSANANLWQDGSGLTVADVYTETRAPTPTASHDEASMNNVAAALVSAASPVRCTTKAPSPSPERGTTLASPAVEAMKN